MTKSSTHNIRVLLIDDHALFREGMALLFQAEPGFTMVARCNSGAEAIRVLKSKDVDVVLLDLDLGTEKGADFLDTLQSLEFKGKVLVVTAQVNDRDIPNLIRKGIAGILMKHNPPTLLLQGIRDALSGKVWFDQGLLQRALTHSEEEDLVANRELSDRDKKVLSLVLEGLSNKEIASRVQTSESGVKRSLRHLFEKTGVRTRGQLVRVAIEQYRRGE
jgi:two-component system, NarL family, nitrate/nitrite response regulator NarL